MNIPVLRGVIVNTRTVEDWLVSSDGVTPWSVDDVMGQAGFSETQGLIEPIIIAAAEFSTDPVTGAYTYSYAIIPERIEKLAQRLIAWMNLRTTPSSEKKIAIIYYNYPPGKSEIGASYLNVPESILEILLNLRASGYITGDISNVTELVSLMIERGINVASWAPGELEKLANTTGVILWDADEYNAWFQTLNPVARRYVTEGPTAYIEELVKMALSEKVGSDTIMKTLNSWYSEMKTCISASGEKRSQGLQLLEVMYTALRGIINGNFSLWDTFQSARASFMLLAIPGLCGWGEAPGNIMTVERNGKKYIVIPGILSGNVFIGPQPQRGWEADPEMIYTVGVLPPHHQYLAYYAWVNSIFNASAMIHMGTMGSYEWLPGKEIMLAGFDFPDIVVDTTPSIYIYRVDNAADGLAAKRRGLAVIIDHLTPAMKSAGLYGELLELRNLINSYKNAADQQLRDQYLTEIKNTTIRAGLEAEIGLVIENATPDALISALSSYLLRIEGTLIPWGLHTFGRAWSSEAITYMVASMIQAGDASIYRLLAADYGWIYEELTPEQMEILENRTLSMVRALVDGSSPENITPQPDLQGILRQALNYIDLIRKSTSMEMSSLLNALKGGYVEPGLGKEPMMNPSALPTGRNFYTIDPSVVPTQAAYNLGALIADRVLAGYTELPEKVAVVIWGVDTARDDGAMVSFVLNLMGVKPIWSSGRATGVTLIPLSELGRPRIDAVVTVSGLFRDVYGQVAILMDRAFRLALAASYNTILNQTPEVSEALEAAVKPLRTLKLFTPGNDTLEMNYVAKHWLQLATKYIDAGMDPAAAGDMAIYRIFAPPLGSYGTGVKEAGEMSWTYNSTDELAELFMNRMGTSYSETGWGVKNVDLFGDLLSGVSAVYQGRATYLVGVAENDDMADYLGGLSLAIRKLTGKAPEVGIITTATGRPDILSLQSAIALDMRTRFLNPEYVKSLISEGYAGANRLSTAVRSLWLWQTTAPDGIPSWAWDALADTYIRDVNGLGVKDWLSGSNSYAMISITGTMLTAAYEGYWDADEGTLRLLASTWASLTAENGVACCDCSCGNLAMMEWAMQYVNPDLLARVKARLYAATRNAAFASQEEPDTVTPDIPSRPGGEHGGVSPGGTGTSRPSGSSRAGVSAATAGAASQETATESPGEQQKAYEVSTSRSQTSSNTGLPLPAIIGVMVLVGLVGAGYFMGGRGKL